MINKKSIINKKRINYNDKLYKKNEIKLYDLIPFKYNSNPKHSGWTTEERIKLHQNGVKLSTLKNAKKKELLINFNSNHTYVVVDIDIKHDNLERDKVVKLIKQFLKHNHIDFYIELSKNNGVHIVFKVKKIEKLNKIVYNYKGYNIEILKDWVSIAEKLYNNYHGSYKDIYQFIRFSKAENPIVYKKFIDFMDDNFEKQIFKSNLNFIKKDNKTDVLDTSDRMWELNKNLKDIDINEVLDKFDIDYVDYTDYVKLQTIETDDGNNPDGFIYKNNPNVFLDPHNGLKYPVLSILKSLTKLNESEILKQLNIKINQFYKLYTPDELIKLKNDYINLNDINFKKDKLNLIISPTGSGKTTAIFKYGIDNLINGTYKKVFYVEPTKIQVEQNYTNLEQIAIGFKVGKVFEGQSFDEKADIISTTYDSLIYKIKDKLNKKLLKNSLFVFDEIHELLTRLGSYDVNSKKQQTKFFIDYLIENGATVVLLSATPEEIVLMDKLYIIEFKKEKLIDKINVKMLSKKQKFIDSITQILIDNVKSNYKTIVFYEDIEKLHLIKKILVEKDIAKSDEIAVYHNSDENGNSAKGSLDKVSKNVKDNITKRELIPENIKIMLTTSAIMSGINLKNTNYKAIIPFINISKAEFVQFVSRFRNGLKEVIVLTKERKNVSFIDSKSKFDYIKEETKNEINQINPIIKKLYNDFNEAAKQTNFKFSINGMIVSHPDEINYEFPESYIIFNHFLKKVELDELKLMYDLYMENKKAFNSNPYNLKSLCKNFSLSKFYDKNSFSGKLRLKLEKTKKKFKQFIKKTKGIAAFIYTEFYDVFVNEIESFIKDLNLNDKDNDVVSNVVSEDTYKEFFMYKAKDEVKKHKVKKTYRKIIEQAIKNETLKGVVIQTLTRWMRINLINFEDDKLKQSALTSNYAFGLINDRVRLTRDFIKVKKDNIIPTPANKQTFEVKKYILEHKDTFIGKTKKEVLEELDTLGYKLLKIERILDIAFDTKLILKHKKRNHIITHFNFYKSYTKVDILNFVEQKKKEYKEVRDKKLKTLINQMNLSFSF